MKFSTTVMRKSFPSLYIFSRQLPRIIGLRSLIDMSDVDISSMAGNRSLQRAKKKLSNI